MGRRELDVIQCPDEDMLRRLLEFDDAFLSRTASTSAEVVGHRFRRCPSAFQCVVHVTDANAPDLHGYFVLLPLRPAAEQAIRRGEISASSDIPLDQIAEADEAAAAVYLSVVCARGPRAQAAAIAGVKSALRLRYRERGAQVMFVRAATDAGARILERLTGTPFVADGKMHIIELGAYPEMRE